MNLLYNICSNTLWLNLRIWTKYNVINKKFIPPRGTLLVISNHQSNIDAGLLGASINRRLRWPAKIELFQNPLMGGFLRSYGAFPVKRESVDINSFRNMKSILTEKNGALGMFPEGTRSTKGLIKAKQGAAKIANILSPTILPVGITGTSHLEGLFRVFNPTGNITVTIGRPFKINPLSKNKSDDENLFENITTEMMRRIAHLLPQEKRGVYLTESDEHFTLTSEV